MWGGRTKWRGSCPFCETFPENIAQGIRNRYDIGTTDESVVRPVLEIPLERRSEIPLYRQITAHLMRMIESGTLADGTRLPGTRELASELGISRTTATLAYDLLEDEGYLRRSGRRGTFVTSRFRLHPVSRKEAPPLIDMASGLPSADLMPWEKLSTLSRLVFSRYGHAVLEGAPLPGLQALRQALVRHAATRGIPARWENVLVTSGVQQGLFLSFQTLALRGVKRVWVEELTYPDALSMSENAGLSLRSVPLDVEGILESCRRMGQTDVLYLVPSFQNPTGRTLSHEGRKAILEVAARRGFWIIEDDAYGELRYGEHSVPALRALESAEKVIYLGSFSQLLFPGIRQGYALVPDEILWDFCETLSRSAGAVSSLLQRLVAAFLEEGHLEPCLETARAAMSVRMRQIAQKFGQHLPEAVFDVPQGGIYLWVTLPGAQDQALAELATKAGVEVACGREFSLSGRETGSVRLSISRTGSPLIAKAVGRLADAWRDLS